MSDNLRFVITTFKYILIMNFSIEPVNDKAE